MTTGEPPAGSDVAERLAPYTATRVPHGRRGCGVYGLVVAAEMARLAERHVEATPPFGDEVRFAAAVRLERRSGHDRRMVTA